MTARVYDLHVYDRKTRIMEDKTFTLAYDRDVQGPVAYAQEANLDAMLRALAQIAAKIEYSDPEDVRIELIDPDRGDKVLDWIRR